MSDNPNGVTSSNVTIYNSRYYNENERSDNIFAPDFFTSSDISIVINGEKIRDISAIQYTLQEQLKPIFGYGSYTYDDIAVGSRIVTGTIVCPMRNTSDNREFECVNTNSKEIKIAAKNYLKEKEDNSEIKNREYILNFDESVPVYLGPDFNQKICNVLNNNVIIKNETDEYYYVYLVEENVFGYIKKGELL